MTIRRLSDSHANVVFVGPITGPHGGQTIATKTMRDLFEEVGLTLDVYDWGGGQLQKIAKNIGAARSVLASPAPYAYLSVNSRRGIVLTVLLCLAARLSGKSIVLHYHGGRNIARWEPLVALLAKLAGPRAMHVTQSEGMAAELRARYGVREAMGFSNIGSVDPRPMSRKAGGPVVLGHLGNLTEAKGVHEAICALGRALNDDIDARLFIAGPCSDSFAERAIAHAGQRFGSRFRYFGPVWGEAKRDFFRSIDVFLFPSRYQDETQGIVNLEALAAGVPVVAFEAGRIRQDIGIDGGMAIPRDADYADAVLSYLRTLAPAAASYRARERFAALLAEHRSERSRLLARFGAQVPDDQLLAV